MNDRDLQGREYLKLADAKAYSIVELDDGFTCKPAGKVNLLPDSIGLYFECNDSKHYIHGQADDDIHCIGIYPT